MKKTSHSLWTRLTAALLSLVCILGLFPTTAFAAGSTIKLKDFGMSGVSYTSAALGTCSLHQMYLNTQNAASYLPRILSDVLDGKLEALGSRMGKQLFKLAVEQDMISNIVAAVYEITPDDIERLRVRCIREIKRTNGEVKLEDAVKYQNDRRDQWSD